MHKCAADGCTRMIKKTLVMCPEHWRQVSPFTQQRIWDAWRSIEPYLQNWEEIGRMEYLQRVRAHNDAVAAAVKEVIV